MPVSYIAENSFVFLVCEFLGGTATLDSFLIKLGTDEPRKKD